jgi:hypothetical protein
MSNSILAELQSVLSKFGAKIVIIFYICKYFEKNKENKIKNRENKDNMKHD